MAIVYDASSKTFNLSTSKTSYVLKVLDSNHVAHVYWGKKIKAKNLDYVLRSKNWGSFLTNTDNIDDFMLEMTPQEYPGYGSTDLRTPAVELQFSDGTSATDFRYESHNIYAGKNKLNNLPATYVEDENEAMTLELTLVDSLKNVKLILSYSVFEEFDAITRSVKIINESNEDVNINRVLSANVDFRDSDYELLQLSGAWARERHIIRKEIRSGSQSIESRRGSSSHAQNPFMALVRKDTTEQHGEVYGFSLVYSGNFLANVEVDMYENARAQIGINPFDFTWLLKSKEEFTAPEAVLVYSNEGLTGMSHIYNCLYGKRLCRGKYRDEVRPILINNWEATYFDFNETKIKEIAREATNLGMELFVLDDGWFGKRNDDKSSLGDWFVDRNKLPKGLDDLVKKITDLGLEFGIWFEPEMISEDSNLYKIHPDWCLRVPSRDPIVGRNQLVLDLSRREICDYVIESVSNILSNPLITYVKWDMNRHLTDLWSNELPPKRQKETAHRYMLGLYYILENLTRKFPDVLFESCSSGGGRFDAGMLYYMPQTWTSDNTDAVCRMKIQYGTSLVYPPITMGAHLSDVPNNQVGRVTPLETRAHVAMSANFGYELDLTKISEEEKESIKEQVKLYKEIRDIVQFGDFYRILSPFEGNEAAWNMVSKNKEEFVGMYFKILSEPATSIKILKFKGLNPNYYYEDIETKEVFGGDELMNVGITLKRVKKDFISKLWRFKKV